MRSNFVPPLLSTIVGLSAFVLTTSTPSESRAALIFFTDRGSFNAANPGLPVETFSAANVAPGAFATINSPLNNSTNNSVFAAGSILPGLTFTNSIGTTQPAIVVVGDGTVTGSTKAVGNNLFSQPPELDFAPGVASVGSTLFASSGPGATLASTFTVTVFGSSGLLGSTTVSEAAGAFAFFGVTSTSGGITRITLTSSLDGTASVFVDNVAFGNSVVPEPSSLFLSLAGFGLIGMAGSRRYRRRA